MKRSTVHRVIRAVLCLAVVVGLQPSSADTKDSSQPAALALTAAVSLKAIESVLRSRINGGKPIAGRKDGQHSSKQGGFGIAYRVNVMKLTVTPSKGDLLVTVPVLLTPVTGKDSMIWMSPLLSVVFAPAGCRTTTVTVATRVKLAADKGRLNATATAAGATIGGACRIRKQQNADIVLQPLRWNPQLREGIDALLGWSVHQTIRDTVATAVSGAIRAQLSQEALAKLVADFQARAVAQFSQPIQLPLASTELALHVGKELELLDVAVEGAYLRIDTRAMVSPQLIFDGAPDPAQSSLGSGQGFRLPLDLVLPLAPLAHGKVIEELTIGIPNSDESLGLARVPGHADLIRVRRTNPGGAAKLVYFAARPLVDDSVALSGNFGELLGEASLWLADEKRWPASVRRDTALLSQQVEVFRRTLLAALAGLGSFELRPGVSFALTEPAIVLGDGRINDNLIRIPAVLSGFAAVSLTIE